MQMAIALAASDRTKGGYGIGAVIVKKGTLISRGTTTVQKCCDPTLHAEINAIRVACRKLKSRTLEGCDLYSTFEPCPMCTSAAIWARMRGITFGALMSDHTRKTHQRVLIPAYQIVRLGVPRLEILGGLLRDECRSQLK